MKASDILRLRNYLEKEGITFCYSGYMTEDTLYGIGEAIKRKLNFDEADKKTARRVFSVFVEQVQNVIRYSAENQSRSTNSNEEDLRHGILTVGRSNDAFFVACGNKVRQQDVARLRSKLSEIQQLDKSEIRARYKETLRGETPEGSKGAGVGFFEIARQASDGIEFDFAPIDDAFSFFTLKAYI
jgi:hypothetical protein